MVPLPKCHKCGESPAGMIPFPTEADPYWCAPCVRARVVELEELATRYRTDLATERDRVVNLVDNGEVLERQREQARAEVERLKDKLDTARQDLVHEEYVEYVELGNIPRDKRTEAESNRLRKLAQVLRFKFGDPGYQVALDKIAEALQTQLKEHMQPLLDAVDSLIEAWESDENEHLYNAIRLIKKVRAKLGPKEEDDDGTDS